MALGTLTIVKVVEMGNAKHVRLTLPGDGAYPSGGTTGFLAALRAELGDTGLNIISAKGCSPPATVSELEYDFANDKLFARVRATGVESAVSDQSAVTYGMSLTVY